ncbi:hypothetical protein ILYODFUR_032591, partial [Ilyodon furcidens]
QKNITAEPGQNITLSCEAPDGKTIIVVEWSRTDFEKEYVLLYKDEQLDPFYQDQSFKNRVDLDYGLMKYGNISLVLKNVTTDDTGTYKCRIQNQGNRERKIICSIKLNVVPPPSSTPPGDRTGSEEDGGKKNISVVLIDVPLVCIIFVVAGILIYKKTSCWIQKPGSSESANPEAV